MAYHCKDCSYRGVKSGQLGECPACGSFNIVKSIAVPAKESSPAKKWRLVVLVLLWVVFLALVIGKLVR
jgi:predicted ATP-dependent serine protease